MTLQTLKPLGDRILIKLVKPDFVNGRDYKIIIPETLAEKTWSTYQVVRLGTKREKAKRCTKCGHVDHKPFEVNEGDVVSIKPYAGIEFKSDGEEYRIVGSEELTGVYQ